MEVNYNGVDGGGNPLNFTKDDLKTGMIVEVGNGDKFTVFLDSVHGYNESKDVLVHQTETSWFGLNNFNKEMINEDDESSWSIVKVSKPSHPYDFTRNHQPHKRTLLWERKEVSKEEQERLDKVDAVNFIIQDLESKLTEAKSKLEEFSNG